MPNLNVIEINRRTEKRSDESNEGIQFKNKRKPKSNFILEKEVDDLIGFYERKMLDLNVELRDKEKKKLTILASTYTILSLLISFLLASAKIYSGKLDIFSTLGIGGGFLAFLAIISFANIAVIKLLVSIKIDHLLATRQSNCLRQAMHTLWFAKWERHFPKRMLETKMDEKELIDTIVDEDTKFWGIYGRHEKYPLNNLELREHYMKLKESMKKSFSFKKVLLSSGDIFSIYVIAGFTFALMLAPLLVFILFTNTILNPSSWAAMGIGVMCFIIAMTFWSTVKLLVDDALGEIVKMLVKDENFSYNQIKSSK